MSMDELVAADLNQLNMVVADRIVARLAGKLSEGESIDLRAEIETINDVTARNVFERIKDLPLDPDGAFQFKHIDRFNKLAWKFYGGGGFYLKKPDVIQAYPLIFLTEHVLNNEAYRRAHGPLVTGYLRAALKAGIMPPDVLAITCTANAFPDFTVEYLAHNDRAFNSYKNNLGVLQRTPRNANSDHAHELEDTLSYAATIRFNLFQYRWLCAAISPAEYTNVAHLQGGMLQELYPDVYDGGYELFYENTQLKLRQNIIGALTESES